MAIALTQPAVTNASGWTTSLDLTFGSTTTAGSLLVVVIGRIHDAVSTVRDNSSNDFTQAVTQGDSCYIYYRENATAATSVTVTFASGTNCYAVAMEWSGVATSASLDKTGAEAHSWGTGPYNVALSATTTEANELLIAGINRSGTVVDAWGYQSGDGWVERANYASGGQYFHAVSRVVAATSQYAHEWTVTTDAASNPNMVIASFKASGATPELEEPGAGATVIAGIVPTAAQYLFQHAIPTADISDGGWVTYYESGLPGNNVDLFQDINDGNGPDDTNMIRSGLTPANDTMITQLSPIVTPEAGAVTIKVRARYC